jgi:hypothetical protein
MWFALSNNNRTFVGDIFNLRHDVVVEGNTSETRLSHWTTMTNNGGLRIVAYDDAMRQIFFQDFGIGGRGRFGGGPGEGGRLIRIGI